MRQERDAALRERDRALKRASASRAHYRAMLRERNEALEALTSDDAVEAATHALIPALVRLLRLRDPRPDRGGSARAARGGLHAREWRAGDSTLGEEGMSDTAKQLAITKMERDWVLAAWAAACDVPIERAEADMLAWSSKWRQGAIEEAESVVHQPTVEKVVAALRDGNRVRHASSPPAGARIIATFVEREFGAASEER
jgi:hypothetical protein